MTKLEYAFQEAEKLPDDAREQLGENVLHYVHKYLALKEDLEAGLKDIDAGRIVDGKAVFAKLKAKYGA